MEMKKKTALITGSTSGIGLGLARAFASKGYNVAFNGLEENGPDIARKVAGEFGAQYTFSSTDMTNPEGLRALVAECVARFGSIDVLINNAGIQHVSPVESFPESKWDQILAVNLSAAFHLIKASWTHMKRQQFGRIINVASAHGLFASEFKSAYVASKHGLVGLTKTIALEGAPFNITCNAICPGYVRTPLLEKQLPTQMRAHNLTEEEVISRIILAKQSVKDFVPVEMIADMALLIASYNASTITGATLSLDGGWSAQ